MHRTLLEYPHLLSQWHPTLNDCSPHVINHGSHKKFWWICSFKDDHIWDMSPLKRTNGKQGCPYCANKRVTHSNCLATTHPELAKQWHPYKNGNLKPDSIVAGSKTKVWWKCDKSNDHKWQSSPQIRSRQKQNCPCCRGLKVVNSNCLATTHPELITEWHHTLNKKTPHDFVAGSIKKVWWKCKLGHEWLSQINNRTSQCKSGCPICNESKGEKRIAEILQNMNINFTRQHRFPSCKNKISLPFDFLFNFDNQVGVIEYHGIQHYQPVKFHKNCDANHMLHEIQKRDIIKTEWCKKMGIKLIVIPYTEFTNIDIILNTFFYHLRPRRLNITSISPPAQPVDPI